MKKLFFFFLVFFVVAIAALLVAEKSYISPKIKELIEKEGSVALGTPVSIEKVDLELFPPVTLRVNNIRFDLKSPVDTLVGISEVKISVDFLEIFSGRLVADVLVDQPRLTVALSETGMPTTSTPAPARPSSSPSAQKQLEQIQSHVALGMKLTVKKGLVTVSQGNNTLTLTGLGVNVDAADLSAPWKMAVVGTNADVNWAGIATSAPVKVTSEMSVNYPQVSTKKTIVDVGGIAVSIVGSANIEQEQHSWDATVSVPDLRALPLPPAFLPTGQWSGSINTSVHAEHHKGADWTARGQTALKNIAGRNIQFEKDGNSVKGDVLTNADVDFSYQKTISLSKIIADGDLKNLAVSMGKYFVKPASVPMGFTVNAQEASNILTVKIATGTLAHFNASVSGTVSAQKGQSSRLRLVLPKTQLAGFEKFFPMLAQTPLQGAVEARAEISGDLQDPMSMYVKVNPVHVENFRGSIKYETPDKSKIMEGPFSVNARAVVEARGKDLLSAMVNTQVDLTGMKLEMEKQFRKNAGSPLRLNIIAQKKGANIEITSANFMSAAGTMIVKGTVREPQAPTMNLHFSIPKVDFAQASILVPMLAEWKLAGSGTADVNLSGKFDFKQGIEKSPLRLTGRASANLPQFIYSKQKTSGGESASGDQKSEQKKSVATAAGEPKPEPLLPPWPIARTMDMQTTVTIGHVEAMGLKLDGLQASSRVVQGQLTANAQVRQIFSGSGSADNIRMSLVESQPTAQLHTRFSNIDIAQALTFAAPEWKDLAKGNVTGEMTLAVAHPSRKDFVNATAAQGNVRITNGFLSTLPFDQYVNKKLASIPGLGNKGNVNTKGQNYTMDSQFNFAQSLLNLKTLNIATPEKNEFHGAGWIKVDKTVELKGTAVLADAPVSGSVREANSDAQGRLMVPVHVTGNVMSPSLSIAEEAIKEMLSRTAKHEAEKFKQQAVGKAKEEMQKQIQDEASKRLKGLFGN